MGELGVLFNPGMRHEREEKLAKQMLREDEGTGRKGRLRIDLESGVVVINSPAARPADASEAPTDARPTGDARLTGDDVAAGDDGATDRQPADTPSADRASTGADRASTGDRPARAPRNGSRAEQQSTTAVPSGKARRGSETADRGKPTGKSRRRGR